MINNTNQILLFMSIVVVFVVAMVFIVRTKIKEYRIRETKPTINHEFTDGEYNQYTTYDGEEIVSNRVLKEYDYILITDLCQFCNQVDHIHINSKFIQGLIDYNHKNIGIGEYTVWHIDHRITHYINVDNEYVSSQIPSLDLRKMEDRLNDELSINGVD